MTLIVVLRVRKADIIMWSSKDPAKPYDNRGPQSFASEVHRIVFLSLDQNHFPDVSYREVSDGTA
jgi:hypothetical protein